MGKRNQDKNKPIVQLDRPNGKPVAYWPSAKEAADFYNINQANISYNVNGKLKQAKGHYFRYATDKETETYEAGIARIEADNITDASPVANENEKNIHPVETIPEVVEPTDVQDDTLSPFNRLLQKSKKMFNGE